MPDPRKDYNMLKVAYSFTTIKQLLVSCSARRCVSSRAGYHRVSEVHGASGTVFLHSPKSSDFHGLKQLSLNMIREEEFSPMLRFLTL